MIRIFKSKDAWHLIDDHLSLEPFVYDDIRYLIEDITFILESHNIGGKENGEENE